MDVSPAKRRVLGAIDPNTCSPKVRHGQPQSALNLGKPKFATASAAPAATPPTRASSRSLEREPESRKHRSQTPSTTSRDSGSESEAPAPKRTRLNDTNEDAHRQQAEPAPDSPPPSSSTTRTSTTTRHRSASPDTPSVFDASAADNTQTTILTEPDTAARGPASAPAAAPMPVPAPPTRRRLTREQAREKAEILRLRLGLASYKVRTGQTDVPLERLEMRRLGGETALALTRATSGCAHGQDGTRRAATAVAAVSASFPLAAPEAGAQKRKPLPAAPVRRASSVSVGTQNGDFAVTEGHGRGDNARVEPVRHEPQRRPQQQQVWRAPEGDGKDNQRGEGAPLGRHSFAEVGAPFQKRSSSLAAADASDEGLESGDDDGRRGGAASGLLSLARS